jgi:hypothetical protein
MAFVIVSAALATLGVGAGLYNYFGSSPAPETKLPHGLKSNPLISEINKGVEEWKPKGEVGILVDQSFVLPETVHTNIKQVVASKEDIRAFEKKVRPMVGELTTKLSIPPPPPPPPTILVSSPSKSETSTIITLTLELQNFSGKLRSVTTEEKVGSNPLHLEIVSFSNKRKLRPAQPIVKEKEESFGDQLKKITLRPTEVVVRKVEESEFSKSLKKRARVENGFEIS